MPTLAEIRAANKAKLEHNEASALSLVERVTEQPIQVKEEPATEVTGKPLSFAEKMALKKKGLPTTNASAQAATSPSQQEVISSTKVSIVDGVIEVAVAQEQSVLAKVISLVAPVYVAEIETTDLERAEYLEASEEVKLAYRDIKGRVNALSTLDDGTHLETAMSELKKALLQNPSACLLLYDEDLGTLASTLRRLVHEDMVASIKVPKEKKEAKQKVLALQIPLTQEMLSQKFADL